MYYLDNNPKDAIYAVGTEKASGKNIYLHKQKKDFDDDDYEEVLTKLVTKKQSKKTVEIDDDIVELIKNASKKPKSTTYTAKSKIIPLLKYYWFNSVVIIGKSGAGKTKIVVKMLEQYLGNWKKHYPKLKKPNVFLISKKNSDKMIDQIEHYKLDPETFIADPIQLEEVEEHSIWIFDDFEQYADNKIIFKHILALLNDLLTLGRTRLTTIFTVVHNSALGKMGTLLLNESNYLVVYNSSTFYSLESILKKKLGYDKKIY